MNNPGGGWSTQHEDPSQHDVLNEQPSEPEPSIKTVRVGPDTWLEALPLFLAVYAHGEEKAGREEAYRTLQTVAGLADAHVNWVKKAHELHSEFKQVLFNLRVETQTVACWDDEDLAGHTIDSAVESLFSNLNELERLIARI